MNFQDTWGTYKWFTSKGMELIHPEDHDIVSDSVFGAYLFHCTKVTSDGYLVLEQGERCYRVKPDNLYSIKPPPTFFVGDRVRDKNDRSRAGTIREIFWHYKRRREGYMLTIGDRLSSKWYFDDDLELIPE